MLSDVACNVVLIVAQQDGAEGVMTFRACLVVPVFNHGNGAVALARKLEPLNIPTFLVNDGSDLKTYDALHKLAADYDWLTVIDHPENQGKGAAVLSGLRAGHAAGFSHALQIDADGQHDSSEIPHFLSVAEAHPQAVITGQPEYDESVPKGRLFARYITHVWVWIETLSFTIKDSMCGFRVYPLMPVLAVANRTHIGLRMDFDPEILVRLHWEGLDILSLPTRVSYPADGQSHFRLWHDNCLISWMHTRLVVEMLWKVLRLKSIGPRKQRR
jgi:glycosyltransferase involved in cell wall biosynthesis